MKKQGGRRDEHAHHGTRVLPAVAELATIVEPIAERRADAADLAMAGSRLTHRLTDEGLSLRNGADYLVTTETAAKQSHYERPDDEPAMTLLPRFAATISTRWTGFEKDGREINVRVEGQLTFNTSTACTMLR